MATIPITLPFDVSNPATQAFPQIMPAPPSVVYRPSGTRLGNVYTTLAQAVTAAAGMPGQKTVAIDLSLHGDVDTWNTGAALDFGGDVLLVGMRNPANGALPSITFDANTRIAASGRIEVRDLAIAVATSNTGPVITLDATHQVDVVASGHASIVAKGASREWVRSSVAGQTVTLDGFASLPAGQGDSGSTFAAFNTTTGTLDVECMGAAIVQAGTVDASCNLNLYSAGATVDASFGAQINLFPGVLYAASGLPGTVGVTATAPGAVYLNTASGTGYYWDGAAWVAQSGGGGGSVPTGTGFYHVTGGAMDPAARAVDLASADVTGVLPTGNQAAQAMAGDVTGTTAGAVVAKVNGATVPAAGGLTTGAVLRATGASSLGYGAVDLANASAVTGQLPATNLTTALASPPAIGGTAAAAVKATALTATTSIQGAGSTDDFGASGTTLTSLDTEFVSGSGTKAVLRNGVRTAAATLSDNTTWVELATISAAVLANNTGTDFLLKILAVDYSASSNTQVSGDVATMWIEFLVTVSAAGVITVSSGITNSTGTLTLVALAGSVLSTIGGTTGTTNPLNGLRARVSGATVVVEAQGAPSKSYRVACTPQAVTRIF